MHAFVLYASVESEHSVSLSSENHIHITLPVREARVPKASCSTLRSVSFVTEPSILDIVELTNTQTHDDESTDLSRRGKP